MSSPSDIPLSLIDYSPSLLVLYTIHIILWCRHKGLPDAFSNSEGIAFGLLYWLWWIIKAWGMYEYALKR
jgi:hypothetical protein